MKRATEKLRLINYLIELDKLDAANFLLKEFLVEFEQYKKEKKYGNRRK